MKRLFETRKHLSSANEPISAVSRPSLSEWSEDGGSAWGFSAREVGRFMQHFLRGTRPSTFWNHPTEKSDWRVSFPLHCIFMTVFWSKIDLLKCRFHMSTSTRPSHFTCQDNDFRSHDQFLSWSVLDLKCQVTCHRSDLRPSICCTAVISHLKSLTESFRTIKD
jgi:hypothetical protein